MNATYDIVLKNLVPIYNDICKLNGSDFVGSFDILCGGFPCQAFSHAAHGNNIAEKNLWGEMYRFVQESNADVPMLVTLLGITKVVKLEF